MKRNGLHCESMPVTYYHGGPAGRERGAYILPPSVTGQRSTADFPGGSVCDRAKVYVTTSFDAALLYASANRRGAVYEVRPLGDLIHDGDCSEAGLSYACDKAIVIKIIKPSADQIAAARYALVTP